MHRIKCSKNYSHACLLMLFFFVVVFLFLFGVFFYLSIHQVISYKINTNDI